MNTADREPFLDPELGADPAPDALDRLLAEIRVPVAVGWSRQVMERLPARAAGRSRASRREWAVAMALAAVLMVVAAIVVRGGESASTGVATSIVDLMIATVAAGAGFLAASWRGLGETVSSALDGSPTALLALGLAALAANGLLVLLLRRRRAAARTDAKR